eukprot:5426226-Amphidinium_carterae.4
MQIIRWTDGGRALCSEAPTCAKTNKSPTNLMTVLAHTLSRTLRGDGGYCATVHYHSLCFGKYGGSKLLVLKDERVGFASTLSVVSPSLSHLPVYTARGKS